MARFEYKLSRKASITAENEADAQRVIAKKANDFLNVMGIESGEIFGEPWTFNPDAQVTVSKVRGPRKKKEA